MAKGERGAADAIAQQQKGEVIGGAESLFPPIHPISSPFDVQSLLLAAVAAERARANQLAALALSLSRVVVETVEKQENVGNQGSSMEMQRRSSKDRDKRLSFTRFFNTSQGCNSYTLFRHCLNCRALLLVRLFFSNRFHAVVVFLLSVHTFWLLLQFVFGISQLATAIAGKGPPMSSVI
jgi:hypothetical protein